MTHAVTLDVRAPRLPHGGYYYAIAVLVGYPGYSLASPPSCAVSSNMEKTVYGVVRRGRRVALSLLPASSTADRWCPGGIYEGAVYAVPHKPRCTGRYHCTGSSAEYGPCWDLEGHPVCGVVAPPPQPAPPPPSPQPTPQPAPEGPQPSYSYPGGLPGPIDSSTKIVARFTLRFPEVGSSRIAQVAAVSRRRLRPAERSSHSSRTACGETPR